MGVLICFFFGMAPVDSKVATTQQSFIFYLVVTGFPLMLLVTKYSDKLIIYATKAAYATFMGWCIFIPV